MVELRCVHRHKLNLNSQSSKHLETFSSVCFQFLLLLLFCTFYYYNFFYKMCFTLQNASQENDMCMQYVYALLISMFIFEVRLHYYDFI